MKIKIVLGYRQDQEETIDADEAHKAYYLFLNPEERGVFKNGLAIVGKDIQRIVPDYHATMGWNPDWKMNGDDWNEVRGKEIDKKIKNILVEGKELAYEIIRTGETTKLNKPLNLLLENGKK